MTLMKRERHWPLDAAWSQDPIESDFRDLLRGFFGTGMERFAESAKIPVARG